MAPAFDKSQVLVVDDESHIANALRIVARLSTRARRILCRVHTGRPAARA